MNKSDNSNTRGYELVNFCEFDKYAAKSYCAIHGVDESLNLGDITKVDEHNLEPFNMICGGSPCFVEGTLVLTENGYIPIEKVVRGDKVLTHKNEYRTVVDTMTNETRKLVGFRTSVSETIYCTPEHPIYIREKSKKRDEQHKSYHRVFDVPHWKAAKDIGVGDYVGTAINQKEEIPQWYGYFYYQNQHQKSMNYKNELEDFFKLPDFWYIVGRYIGDGWLNTHDGKSIKICCEKNESDEVTNRLDRIGFNYSITLERTVAKIQIVKKELYLFLSYFGYGASGKHLTKDVMNLPVDLLREFLNGYIDSDGTFTQGRYKITSVSRRLVYEIGECVAKVYHRPFSVYFTSRPKTHVIEGRIVNQKDTYQLCWKATNCKQDKSFYEDGYIWSPVTKVCKENSNELVYNLEVEKDNSYMVQGVIVHNCQDFSVSGKGAGSMWKCLDCETEYNPLTVHYSKRDRCPNCSGTNLNKTRSSLLVEWLRIIRANKPRWGIYENVRNIVGKKFKETFQMFIEELNEYGYNTYYKVLNAKNYGIPQNRERVYLIIIQKEYDNGLFKFPEPFDSDLRLNDMLEDEVDEKYYINTPKAKELIEDLITSGKLEKAISNTVRGGRGSIDRHQWDIVGEKMNRIIQIGNLRKDSKKFSNPQAGRVYCVEGIAPTINTCQGGEREPKVLVKCELVKDKEMYKKKIVCERRIDEGLRLFQDDSIGTIRTIDSGGDKRVIEKEKQSNDTMFDINHDYRIRKLTPKECWRLMGFSDENFENAKNAGISNTQLYKQAGNSIVTDVLYYIFKELYLAMPYLFDNLKVGSYFSGIGAFEIGLNRLFEDINKKL